MIVTSKLFEHYLDCPTKCWLSSRAEPASRNQYAEWVRTHNEEYIQHAVERLCSTMSESDCVVAPAVPEDPKDLKWHLAIKLNWKGGDLESCMEAVERLPRNRGRPAQFIPYRFEFSNKITKQHKLLVAFDAFLLSAALGRKVPVAQIVHGDHYAKLKVQTPLLANELRKQIKRVTTLLTGEMPPDLILNKNCIHCEYQARCFAYAKEKDELSLLAGISEKERRALHEKGVLTVTQLSYTFRPRRRRRELRDQQEKYHHSLRALAIRRDKIHAVDIAEIKFRGGLVFLDVEGLPDRDFYYLVGVRIKCPNGCVQHSFWASDIIEERLIWTELINVLQGTKEPRLIHYGSYETVFLNRMCKRYGGPPSGSQAAEAIEHATNLLSLIYARIYFPTYSNGLKEIAGYLGFQWSTPLTTGLESIVWRHRWEATKEPDLRQALLDYNQQDCEALDLVTCKLVELSAPQFEGGR